MGDNYIKISIPEALFTSIVYFLITLASSFIFTFRRDNVFSIFILVHLFSYLLFAIYYYIKIKNTNTRFTINFSLNNIKLMPLFFILMILMQMVSDIIIDVYVPSFMKIEYEKASKAILDGIKLYPIRNLLSVVVLTPFFEELFFRGILLKGMLNKRIDPFVSIFISSILFGFMHLNIVQMVGATLMGLVLGYAFYQTGSLLCSVTLHLINNLMVCFFMIKKIDFHIWNSDPIYLVFLLSLSVLVILILYRFNFKNRYKWKSY